MNQPAPLPGIWEGALVFNFIFAHLLYISIKKVLQQLKIIFSAAAKAQCPLVNNSKAPLPVYRQRSLAVAAKPVQQKNSFSAAQAPSQTMRW